MNRACHINPSKIYAVILCGGRGKRLKTITKKIPKPMAVINGRPFLDAVIKYINTQGIKNIILSTGYKSDVIEEYYSGRKKYGKIIISRENKPLGTGGALRLAAEKIKSDVFLALNGDTFCKFNFKKLTGFHAEKKADATILVAESHGQTDAGFIRVDKKMKITMFNEKKQFYPSFINAGVYVFNKEILNRIPCGKKYSLEEQFLPEIKNSYAFVVKNRFLDIGTPDRYYKAGLFFKKSGMSR